MEVINNKKIGPDYYRLDIRAPEIATEGQAGQFVHLKIRSQGTDPLLRRPFSLFDVDDNSGTVSLVYRLVGKGTEIMTGYQQGDQVDLLGPLGRGFSREREDQNLLIIGGGMGIAPLYLLLKRVETTGKINVLLGTACKDELKYFKNTFTGFAKGNKKITIHPACIDGSFGFEGTVVDLWQKLSEKGEIPETDFLYTCGPTPMLRTVQEIAVAKKIAGEVSLEERMGCGIGICLSCVCKTETGNQRVCKEGPVFSLEEVIFDD